MPPFCEKHQRYFLARSDSWLSSCCPNCEQEYAQLARDEEKETSDGQDGCSSTRLDGGDRTSPLDTVVPDKAAPVATSVSAPDPVHGPFMEQASEYLKEWADRYKLYGHEARMKEWSGGQAQYHLANFAGRMAREYASSSSAALDLMRVTAQLWMGRAEAAEVKCAAIEKHWIVRDGLLESAEIEVDALRDALKRLQEELREPAPQQKQGRKI